MRRSPYFPALLVLALALVAGILAPRFGRHATSAEERAIALQRAGHAGAAESIFWELLQASPTVPNVIAFLDAHHVAQILPEGTRAGAHDDDSDDELGGLRKPKRAASVVSEDDIDAFLARTDLPQDVALLGRFWRQFREQRIDPQIHAAVVEAAEATPPMPWANRLLATEAERAENDERAATLLLREAHFATSSASAARDANHALALLRDAKDWNAITLAFKDPAIERAASLGLKAQWGIETNQWGRVARWVFLLCYSRPAAGPLVLTAVAALAWWIFAAQLGKARERPFFRGALYLAAFGLGTLSIPVTDFLILVEESKLHLVETGEPVRDFIYFVFGVGLREELSKLLLFLPLVPFLRLERAKAKAVDVLVCGACVGLGFAAMENVNYLSQGDLAMGMGRFLTANFLHMAMTAILASAAFEFAKEGDAYAPVFSKAALRVIALHGAYDFFITHSQIGGGYLSMTVFFFLVNQFLSAVDGARGRSEPSFGLLRTFTVGTATVAGASFVWASYLVGPAAAGQALVPGLLGMAIIIYAFAQRFQRM